MYNVNSSVPEEISSTSSVKDEKLPVFQRSASCNNDLYLEKSGLQRPKSFSVDHSIEEHKPLLMLMIPQQDPAEAFSTDERFLTVPAATLPMLYRPSRKFRRLNTLLLEAVKYHGVTEIERLIKAGANPNATCCTHFVSVCHLAALRADDALSVLLSFGADKQRSDKLGRTPLHLAAWAGNVKQVAILLGLSKDLQKRVEAGDMNLATEEEVRKLTQCMKDLVDVKCDFSQTNVMLPKDWKDNMIDHDCKDFEKSLPLFQSGWTALHAASARAQSGCARLLIVAGADPCARDLIGRTPLDTAGSAYYSNQTIDPQHFAEIITMLLEFDGKIFTMKNRKTVDTPLHTAVEVNSLEATSALVEANMPVNWLNRAGLTPLHICVKKKLQKHLQILANRGINDANMPTSVDVRDKDGQTVLHVAVMESWRSGVCVAIEAGANITAKVCRPLKLLEQPMPSDNIILLPDNSGETPIHLAAAKGNVDILNDILNAASEDGIIDTTNNHRETPLFKAVRNGHVECVKILLKEGASIEKTLQRQVNVFHVAAENGFLEVLTVLLDHDYIITRRMVNYLTADDKKGYGPIHFAVLNNHPKCVKILLSRNAHRSLRTSYGHQKGSTPLHIAAITNNVEIAKIIIKNNEETVHTVNDLGWTPLHTASHYGSRDIITLLLKEGADLSSCTNGPNKGGRTAINMIMNNLSKPLEYMENIFDTYIYANDSNLQNPNYEITVDYKVLIPKAEEKEQIKVIDALLKTGDRYGQRRLLVHPLLESFLYFKWKALLPFFYTMISFHAFFVFSLTTFTISVFFYKDTKNEAPAVLNACGWAVALYVTVCLIILQEILYMKVCNGYFLQLETWIKFSSVGLAIILPYAVTRTTLTGADWPRHVATGALLLSWLKMMFLLSRFPNWGYYVLMFGKVSANVMKILLTFAFLVIGFSLSFMIQFHSQTPFESPWAALVKTMVMMTSEFDYEDLVKQNDSQEFVTSLLVVRLVFLIFLILAAIVLMNLMVGVAVNDLHNLQVLGNVRRLAKQVEFLGSLENLVHSRLFKKIVPIWLQNIFLRNKKNVLNTFVISPTLSDSKWYRALPLHIREAIFEKAQYQRKQMEDELGSQSYRKKVDEIYEATVKDNNLTNKMRTNSEDIALYNNIKNLENALNEVKIQTKLSIQELKSSIEDVNIKMDMILNKLESNVVP